MSIRKKVEIEEYAKWINKPISYVRTKIVTGCLTTKIEKGVEYILLSNWRIEHYKKKYKDMISK